ncbi:MAG: protein translocase subunit SecD [Lachnospiraceae bacterium]|nr:protein translocase subunit SecD [Lachnospiraceae bacterium]
MSKTKGILTIVLTVLLTVFIGYMDVFGFGANKSGSANDIKLGLDLAGGVSITYQAVGDENPSDQDMSDTVEKLKKRIYAYSTEASVYKEGRDRISIEIPGVYDADEILKDLGRPGTLYFIDHYASDGTPNYSRVSYTGDDAVDWQLNRTLDEIRADGGIVLEGTDVADAQAGTTRNDMGNTQIMVNLSLTKEGTDAFAKATEAAFNRGKDVIGIYYDGEFISVPAVQGVITGGTAQITGQKDAEEAEKLASTIRIGGLSLELEELRSNVVGASLGQNAIQSSLKAGVLGFAVVVVFMIAVYYLLGLASAIALSLYAVLEVMLINGFAITLTLPGIAGIILSIGMAVDANVIIFARIREELATGKTMQSAIKVAYSKAMSAILDGNITTLIAAAVLWIMGSGSIVGFAQTLTLGICLSMFTAVVVTKALLNAFVAAGVKNPKVFGVAKKRERVDFLSKRGLFFGLSGIVIAAGLVFMLALNGNNASRGHSLNFSLDFLGGTQTVVPFDRNYELEEINDLMVSDIEKIADSANVITTKVKNSNEVIFKTVTLNADQRAELNDYFADNYGVDKEMIKTETISSTISKEAQRETIIAVVVACVCMLIYIWFRFKDIRFGASSVLALTHDVLVTLAFYAIAYVSVGSTFVACMLTIVGYSINATIVIFDRIRENLKEAAPKTSLKDIVNDSITTTLSRSIFTSLTTFIMVVALYIFGVSSIKEFALPLMVGIVCGTYSSICLAGSMWFVFKNKFSKKEK